MIEEEKEKISDLKTYFRKVVERDLDDEGLNYFLNLIKKGKMQFEDIKNSILNSPEATQVKLSKYLKLSPVFVSIFSKEETQKLITSVPSWYHSFKFDKMTVPSPRTALEYQMWAAQRIPLDLKGKKILDIGTADGFYSFLCESRGAEKVVAIDFVEFEGFTAVKKILNSKVEHKIMNVFDLEKLDESFDLVLFFGVYYHLDNPIKALQLILPKVNDTLFLAGHVIDNEEPLMCYYDEYEVHPQDASNWWVASPSCIIQASKRIGFTKGELIDDLYIGNPYQSQKVMSSIRHLGKVGVFKLSK